MDRQSIRAVRPRWRRHEAIVAVMAVLAAIAILRLLPANGSTDIAAEMVPHPPTHADMAKRRIDMLDGRIVASAIRAI